MFKTRLLSGIVLVILALILIITGNEVLLAATFLISCIGMYELYRVFHVEKSVLSLISYIAIFVYYCNLRLTVLNDMLIIVMAYLILLMFAYVFAYPKYDAKQIMACFFGFFYVGVMLSYVYQIRCLDNGIYIAFLVFICSWGCDTCAYCVGKLIGKHKMSPKLSPKKSIEGAVGGVVGTAFLAMLYAYIFHGQMEIDSQKILLLGLIAAIAGLISMIGDLTASAIKRNNDIKDYGHLIPGHGGILDRFDSMIITAPIIYYLAKFLFV